MKRTTLVAVMLCLFVFSCNKKKQVTAKFVEIEIVRDTNNNIIMAKSGISDSNNIRTFRYYDTTGRLVLIIEWGGVNNIRRMFSTQFVDTGVNTILAGRYFYKEYFSSVFGAPSNFKRYVGDDTIDNKAAAFDIIDSLMFMNHKFHLSQPEFDNLLNYLRYN